MLKRSALGLVIFIFLAGIVLIGLDVLDINEHYRLHLPVAIFNTIFISAISILVAFIASISYVAKGPPALLAMGCGVLAFGVSSLLKGWLIDRELYLLITIHDYSALIASAIHLVGAFSGMAGLYSAASKPTRGKKTIIMCLCYLGTLASIALISLLAFQGIIPLLGVPDETALLRDVVRGITTILFVASSALYLRRNFKSPIDFYYWYSLGLMLFGFGVIFISQGAVASPIAWWGRVAQYIGGLFFLWATVGAGKLAHENG
jgi:hypothetical protein